MALIILQLQKLRMISDSGVSILSVKPDSSSWSRLQYHVDWLSE